MKQERPSQREEFRSLLATSPVRRIIRSAIRSERQCATVSQRDIAILETLRDRLRETNNAFAAA